MLKNILNIVLYAAVVLSMTSCEKVIDVDLDTSPNQIVIEGNINNMQQLQVIKISQSVPYTDNNSYPPVTGAIVTVTDDVGHKWLFAESKPGFYTTLLLKGQPLQRYTLKVTKDKTTYTAKSTMPQPVNLDSLTLTAFMFGEKELKQVKVHYIDPRSEVNQYQFIMRVNGFRVKNIFVENDRFVNGNDVTSVLFYNSDNDNEKIKKGDKIEVEMRSIDKDIFTYWFSLSQQTQNGSAVGVTPGNPPSNIDNNALGYFSAHTTNTKAIEVN